MPRLSAKDGPREIRAAVLALKQVDRDLRRDINRRMRETMNPVWKGALNERVSWAPEQALLKGARVAAGNPPRILAAASKRPWKRGKTLIPRQHWHALEYGSSSQAYTKYQRRSPLGNVHEVNRRTKAHLKPRNHRGYVIGPSLAEMLPRLSSLFVQSVIRGVLDALETRR